ncbi:UDP-N-acetylglucosamine-dolichyl-phosphate N-acetylglucosaminephosphotransferase [Micractinium conductrix]|uniref:UDP-N-acetylglucosamine--dolichyl-phosphate N-acetylglucosaminephosphotransferase n=1 Tax=Micractinium conductrix TaxID=554055 RepID=A0A2P6V3X8_9CHLO|nr:UDP-N-acetylglucosamine-dolichyl-phosphate N-acetylglucosaminephosphotransferase [Micractinium conductrix]|eukprot:PSC68793.1 UDP-N-acetylglucosamine-dolichyl-phosphate N-acetylglucosaminephosphotransferase [Micractinium conductrix]
MKPAAWLRLVAAGCLAPAIWVVNTQVADERTRLSILTSALVSIAGFFATRRLIPLTKAYTLKAGLWGLDINKKGSREGEKKVPESLGLAAGVVFLICIVLFQQLHYYDIPSLVRSLRAGEWAHALGGSREMEVASDAWLVDYNAALATICFMLFLGFADDVLDIPWRVKLILPCVASLPLLIAYAGGTGVVVPKLLRGPLGLPGYLELGVLYKVYMVMLVIFCSNSINILAGVNGLEAGQTFVIACAVLLHNLTMLAGPAGEYPAVRDGHLFSAYLMMPLAATTLALLAFNWYPAQVFVGDTFTYFAGMTLAVAGILGHFSETLLLFFIPQIINFLYSMPQLFKIVPCPRHRLPRFDPATGLLHATPNMNVVNLVLRLFGPCTELWLCLRILAWQVACCGAAFWARQHLAGWYR